MERLIVVHRVQNILKIVISSSCIEGRLKFFHFPFFVFKSFLGVTLERNLLNAQCVTAVFQCHQIYKSTWTLTAPKKTMVVPFAISISRRSVHWSFTQYAITNLKLRSNAQPVTRRSSTILISKCIICTTQVWWFFHLLLRLELNSAGAVFHSIYFSCAFSIFHTFQSTIKQYKYFIRLSLFLFDCQLDNSK